MNKLPALIMLLLVAASCKELEERNQFPCGDLFNPSFFNFIYVDSNGNSILKPGSTVDAILPCNNNKPEIAVRTENGSAYFVLGRGLWEEKPPFEACPEVYITLNGSDIDTLVLTGNSKLIREGSKECTPLYRFEATKVMFNGVELVKKERERINEPEEYYELRK